MGAASLTYLYEHLGDASFAGTNQIGCYATLLQVIMCHYNCFLYYQQLHYVLTIYIGLLFLVTRGWIYEHFVSISVMNDVLGYEDTSLPVSWWSNKSSLLVIHYRKLINELTINGIRWTPYQVHQIHRSFENVSLFSRSIQLGLYMQIHLSKRVFCQYGFRQNIP